MVSIIPTEFKNTITGTIDYGVRMYTDDLIGYLDFWDDIPDSNLGIMKKILDSGIHEDPISKMLMEIYTYNEDVFIGSTVYGWHELEAMFEAYYNDQNTI